MPSTYYCPICGHDYKEHDVEFEATPGENRRGIFIQSTIRKGDVIMVTCWNEDCEAYGHTGSIERVSTGELSESFGLTIQFDYTTGEGK